MDLHAPIAVFSSEFEAELAQATLAAGGIDSFLKMDDSGGMLPVLQQNRGVKLFVDQEDEEEARSLLGDQAVEPPAG
jgi:hypothetical protein